METESGKKKLGGNVDSWCGKCKMMLAHTIEAMVGDKPARVHCNTCKSQHSYKAHPPATSTRTTRTREPGAPPKTRATRYQTLLKDKDAAAAKSYSFKDTYEPGDVLEHPNFGRGVATAVKEGNKVEVLFETGSKVLIHGR
jgi:hypothetical protein